MAIVRIPTPLRALTGGRPEVAVEGADLRAVLVRLGQDHPGLLERIVDDEGRLRPFVHVFVGAEDVRSREGLATEVGADDTVSIVPAVAGGVA
ncbi:MoaD/ThiS family protein [Egicoccus sp. AB-alg6-2]|uniref:MoaD/ThiS family protein n=1 Tax=Egicoccus sp. AB-alg6-2 TaxID=3242692 RepID=UPI00359D246E